MLLVDPWKGADIETLVRDQLCSHVEMDSERLIVKGDPINLPPDIAVPFGLMLHELATNAVKYGAWSSPAGRVELAWARSGPSGKPVLTTVWRELGGPPVQKPQRSGFGSRLIERGLPKSKVRLEFRPEGLVCTAEIPLPEGGDK
jgi:two-component system CheB/CheR fusion protein